MNLQALCINDAVLKLGSSTRINERCLELQKAKPAKKVATAGTAHGKPAAKKSSCGCPYRKSKRTSLRHLKVMRAACCARCRTSCDCTCCFKLQSSSSVACFHVFTLQSFSSYSAMPPCRRHTYCSQAVRCKCSKTCMP